MNMFRITAVERPGSGGGRILAGGVGRGPVGLAVVLILDLILGGAGLFWFPGAGLRTVRVGFAGVSLFVPESRPAG